MKFTFLIAIFLAVPVHLLMLEDMAPRNGPILNISQIPVKIPIHKKIIRLYIHMNQVQIVHRDQVLMSASESRAQPIFG
jgi:hypothetical protein